jgi:DNA-binding transcriptional LysR family regulator
MKQNFTVRQGALDGVEAFLSVARHRSFRKAAAELGVTPSAMSQAVRTLEARIGAALFIRTTRSVGLTEAGDRFLLRAKPAFEELVGATEDVRDLSQRPAGLLRLTAPRAVVPTLLEQLIAPFCEAYPDVEVEIAATSDLVDIAAEGFDAGIRQGQFIEADMIALRLKPPHPLAVVGSPDYLRRRQRLLTRSANAWESSTFFPNCLARASRREAMLTAGPMMVKSRRVRPDATGWANQTRATRHASSTSTPSAKNIPAVRPRIKRGICDRHERGVWDAVDAASVERRQHGQRKPRLAFSSAVVEQLNVALSRSLDRGVTVRHHVAAGKGAVNAFEAP